MILVTTEAQSGKNNPSYGKMGKKHWGYGKSRPKQVKDKISSALKRKSIPPEILEKRTYSHKTYNFISPMGEEVKIENLSKFCRDNADLDERCMRRVVSGEYSNHKGWRKSEKYDLHIQTKVDKVGGTVYTTR